MRADVPVYGLLAETRKLRELLYREEAV